MALKQQFAEGFDAAVARLERRLSDVRPRSVAVSRLLLDVGVGLMVAATAFLAWSMWSWMRLAGPARLSNGQFFAEFFVALLKMAVAVLVGGAGFRLFQIGRRRLARIRSLAIDAGQPIVLYLRSFRDDVTTNRAVQGFGLLNEEQHLVQVLGAVAPVLAIGMPGEALPQLGANRVLVHEHEWRTTVFRWIGRAELIVLRVGDTPGFWWEVEQVLRLAHPSKVLFVVPHGRWRYEAFVARMKLVKADLEMPAYETHPTEGAVSIAAVLSFASAVRVVWHGLPLPRKAPRRLFEPMAIPIARAVGQALGQRLHPKASWITQALALAFGLVVVGYWTFLASVFIAIAGFFIWLYLEATRYPPPLWELALITILCTLAVLGSGGLGLGVIWYLRSAFRAGAIWPGRPRPGERWYAYLFRLWKLNRLRHPPKKRLKPLIDEALGQVSNGGRPTTSLEQLECSYHAACGVFGSDHPDMVPILLRLSHAYEHCGAEYDAVMSQAAAVHLGRRFFGPGHPEHLASRNRLKSLLVRYPALRSADLSHLMSSS